MMIVRLNRALNFFRSVRRPLGLLVLLGGASAGTLWSSPASASRAYAYVLSSYFEFGGGCPACHNNLVGGFGTATQPLAQTLISLGLRGDDLVSFDAALTQLADSHIDSDGDTISDFDELSPKGDPNDPSVYPPDATPVPSNSTPPTTPPAVTPQTVTPPTVTPPTVTPPTDPAPVTPSVPTTPVTSPNVPASPNEGNAKDTSCSLLAQTRTPNWTAVFSVMSIAGLIYRRRRSAPVIRQLRGVSSPE